MEEIKRLHDELLMMAKALQQAGEMIMLGVHPDKEAMIGESMKSAFEKMMEWLLGLEPDEEP